MRCKQSRTSVLFGAVFLMLLWNPLTAIHAQGVVPDIRYDGPQVPGVAILPRQALANVRNEDAHDYGLSVRFLGSQYPKDSLLTLAAKHAQAWIDQLQTASVKGLQYDPYGTLSVMANQDDLAQRQIATRLATPGLSLSDRAYTLRMAVRAFGDEHVPNRLPIAERYLTQLDALGTEAAFSQFNARLDLVNVYYRLGMSAEVAHIGLQMYAHVTDIPYHLRGAVYDLGPSFQYGAVIDALGGQPNGRAKIKALNTELLAATKAPAELVAFDSSFVWHERDSREWAERWIRAADRVGLQGTPIFAQYWINRGASREAQTVNVADGRIRVVEIGHFSCGPCMAAVPGLNRLHAQYPNAEFLFMTWTEGMWGNRIIEPKEECERLADHFLTHVKAQIPVGIAFSLRDSTPEGLWIPQRATQTFEAGNYPQVTKPTFYVLDGKGIIRHVMFGYDRDLEQNLAQIIEFLQRESQPHGNNAVSTIATPRTGSQ